MLNLHSIHSYTECRSYYLLKEHLIFYLCVFDSKEMRFALEMTYLIDYGVVTVSRWAVIMFPV